MIQLSLEQRISAFSELGLVLNELLADSLHHPISKEYQTRFEQVVNTSFHHNGWFDNLSVHESIKGIASWLNQSSLENWVKQYDLKSTPESKAIGVIMAGNIPLVGFHDILSVLISGNKLVAKTSSKDPLLPKLVTDILISLEPSFEEYIVLTTERFRNIDAIIATGSTNSSKYFEHYFSKYPNIIRKNRHSIAILTGRETEDQLKSLGKDIFTYYGLGCRNVTNIFVPRDYEFKQFFEAIEEYHPVLQNKKYANNYEYNRTVYLLNSEKDLLDNNFIILKPSTAIGSPIGTLAYHKYTTEDEITEIINANHQNIQCLIGKSGLSFGEAQHPQLMDYPDNIDILQFISSL